MTAPREAAGDIAAHSSESDDSNIHELATLSTSPSKTNRIELGDREQRPGCQLAGGFRQSYCGLNPSTRAAFSIEISDSFGLSGRLRFVPGNTSSRSLSLGWLISELLLAMPNTYAPVSFASSDRRM